MQCFFQPKLCNPHHISYTLMYPMAPWLHPHIVQLCDNLSWFCNLFFLLFWSHQPHHLPPQSCYVRALIGYLSILHSYFAILNLKSCCFRIHPSYNLLLQTAFYIHDLLCFRASLGIYQNSLHQESAFPSLNPKLLPQVGMILGDCLVVRQSTTRCTCVT